MRDEGKAAGYQMTKRDHVEESVHSLMISVLVDSLEKDGFTVLADHVGDLRDKPQSIEGYVPDIEARKGGDIHLIEVETQATLDSPGTRDQLQKLVSASGTKAFLAVPHDCIEKATQLRERLEVAVAILPCYPYVRYIGLPK